MKSAIAEIAQTYGIENWGAGYFSINSQGHLAVHPAEGDPRSVDVKRIVDDLVARRVKMPLILRFPQLFASQVRKMNMSFRTAMKEFGYQGSHRAVFPMKVNQRRQVIEAYLEEAKSGARRNFTRRSRSTNRPIHSSSATVSKTTALSTSPLSGRRSARMSSSSSRN
jgi:arginine decarboxylase-like protein